MGSVNELSVLIIAKNEASMIGNCILSARLLSPLEIIVIDDESTDKTVAISKNLGVHVYSHLKKNFAEARNFGFQKAQGLWILYIDADERISSELALEIKNVVNRFPIDYQTYRLRRVNYYLGKRWPKDEKITRLFYKRNLETWYGTIHESPKVKGKISDLKGQLVHYTHRSLTDMVQTTLVWSVMEAKLRFDSGHPSVYWWRFPRVMLPVFIDYFIVQNGWKVGTVGLIESIYQSFSIFITYALLWEMQQKTY